MFGDSLIISLAAGVNSINCGWGLVKSLDGIQYFTGLNNLDCDNNQISSMPDLSALKNLQNFWCYSNQLTSLPGLSALTNLQGLWCDHNQLTSLPDLSNLYNFDCDNNQLTSLPNLSNLTNLNYLSCGGNQLTSLPDLSTLKNLNSFYCWSNQLTSLPKLSNMTNLNYLSCSGNQLTSLPDISNLSNLQTIDCSHNQLSHLPLLPYGLCNLIAQGNVISCLPNLPTGSNCGTSFTSDIGYNICIANYYIDDANFRRYLQTSFPQIMFGDSLITTQALNIDTLVCSGKNISNLDGIQFFYNLRYLDCRNNQLSQLSPPVGLCKLFVAGNNITCLKHVPSGKNCGSFTSDIPLGKCPDLIIYETSVPPVIDGIFDTNGSWTGSWNTLTQNSTANTTFDVSAQMRLTYDNKNLYLIASVNGDNTLDTSSFNIPNSWECDNIEVYVKMDTTSGSNGAYIPGDFQFRMKRAAVFPACFDAWASTYTVNPSTFTTDSGYKIKQTNTASSYIQEWQMPWSDLISNMANDWNGQYIKFDIGVADNTTGFTGGRTQHLFWNSNTDLQWDDTRYFGLVKLATPVVIPIDTTSFITPYTQDFEGASFPPPYWKVKNPDGGITWQSGNTGLNSNGSAYINLANYGNSGQKDAMVTPAFDLKNVSNVYLGFNYAYNDGNMGHNDSLNIYISTDFGRTYIAQPIFSKGGHDLATGSNNDFPSANDWKYVELDLQAYQGKKVVINFQSVSNGYGTDLYIDNVQLFSAVPQAPAIDKISISKIDTVSANINLVVDGNYSPTNAVIYYGQAGSQKGTVTASPAGVTTKNSDLSATLSSLQKGTDYWFYVKVANSIG